MTRYIIHVLKSDFKKALEYCQRNGLWWNISPENAKDEKYIILEMNKCGFAELSNYLRY